MFGSLAQRRYKALRNDGSNNDCSVTAVHSASVPQGSGDHIVLHHTLLDQREKVRRARMDLASTLQQLGEHHVRKKEYDDAMDAFVEALHEKRSAYLEHFPPVESAGDVTMISTDSESSCRSYGALHDVPMHVGIDPEERARELDDIMSTLSNIGNVHSLRGEHSEAMRYYSEVTSIRAHSRSSLSSFDASTSCSGSSISGLGSSIRREEDSSTIISELNEDVKALDDLFRSISFRNDDLSAVGGDRLNPGNDGHGSYRGTRKQKRKVEKDRETGLATAPSRRTRQRAEKGHLRVQSMSSLPTSSSASSLHYQGPALGGPHMSLISSTQSLPTRPSQGTLCVGQPQVAVDQLSQAITSYRSILEAYTGQNLEAHESCYMKFIDSITQLRARKQEEENTRQDSAQNRTVREEELELALDIYGSIISAQRESNLSLSIPNGSNDDDHDPRRIQHSQANMASTLITMGSLHYKLNNVDEELRHYYEALTVYTEALGEKHPYVAGTCKNIGMVLAERCEFDAAMEQFQRARGIYRQANNDNDCCKDVASALSCMGNVHNRRGELEDALNLYGEALHIYKTIAEEDERTTQSDPAIQNVISMLKIIGMAHAKMGNLDDAMECFQEAMDLTRSSDVNSASGVASILTRIAGILYKRGQYDDALEHYQEAHDLLSNEFGTEKHPDIAGILHYIGGIHHKRAKYIDAMECYMQCVKIYHSTLGADNPAVANTLVCIGSIHFKKRSMSRALSHYQEALQLLNNAYGPYHPDVAPTLKSIGMIHAKTGDYDDAMEAFQEVLIVTSAVKGNAHPDVASAYKSLGNVHFKRGEYGAAERQYRQALSICRRSLGEDHPDTTSTMKSIEYIRKKMREIENGVQSELRDSKSGSRGNRSKGLSSTKNFRC